MYSEQHADAALNFFELVLRHTADDWYGKPFLLYPAEEQAIRAIFGNLDENGNRLIEMAYLEWPKKSGKTEFAAGLVLLALVLDGRPGCQVYGAASAQRQAGNVYRAACKMVEQSPILKRELRILRGTNRIMKRNDPESFYAAIAADGDITDGVNPSFVVADEVHRWKTRKQMENWDVLALGGITRRQTLMLAITTAGVQDESPLAWRLHEKTKRILDGVITDEHFYGQLWGAKPGDDWRDERTWIKANPSLKENGGFLELAKLRKYYEDTLSEPDGETSFRRYFLNLWDQKEDRAIDMQRWAENHGGYDLRNDPIATEELIGLWGLAERPCIAGVDLASTTDLTALTLVFPPNEGESEYHVLPFFWVPDARIRERELRDMVPYSQWIKRGFITATPGEAVDYRAVAAKIRWAAEMFDLREVVLDPWNSRQLSVALIDEGFTCVELRQGFQSLSAPTKFLLGLYLDRRLRHANHPVLYWNASCLSLKNDGNDNIRPSKPDRSRDSKRIDGIAALVNALSRCDLGDTGRSVYADEETAHV